MVFHIKYILWRFSVKSVGRRLPGFILPWLSILGFSGLAAAQPVGAEMPDSAPLFAARLADLNDQPVALAGLQGKPLIINFWARWCGPCRDEIPEFIKVQQKFKTQELTVVGIAIDDKTEAVGDFAKAYEINYSVLVAKDAGLELMRKLGNSRAGLPYTLVIDRSGKVIAKKIGLMKRPEIDAALEVLFKR